MTTRNDSTMTLVRTTRATALLVALVALGLSSQPAHAATTHRKTGSAVSKAAHAKPDSAAAKTAPVIPLTREPLAGTLATVKALYATRAAVFVDARSADEYAAGHIAGAISLPFDDAFKQPELAKRLADHGKPIVTYCDGGDCTLSKDLAFTLIDQGHKRVLFYADGFPGWKAGGGATHTGATP